MTEISVEPPIPNTRLQQLQKPTLLALTLLALALVLSVLGSFGGLELEPEALAESTLGRLAIWMADQSGNHPDEILSPLAQYADNWANELGMEALDPAILFNSIRNFRSLYYGVIVLLLVYAVMAIFVRPQRTQRLYFVAILMMDGLLFFIPSLEGSNALALLAAAILVTLLALVTAPGAVSAARLVSSSPCPFCWSAGKPAKPSPIR